MYKTLSLLVLFALHGLFAWGQSKNMTVVGHLAPPTGLIADVQAYVAPNNAEYALMGHEGGVTIVSLADPSQPVAIHEIPGVVTIWREIETHGEYAYVTNEGGDGLRIIDLRGLPSSIQYRDTIIDSIATAHTLYIEDTLLYLFGATRDFGGVSILSISDPWNPVKLGARTQNYVHDAYVRDGIAYLGEIYDGRMEVVDLNDPQNPVSLGAVLTPNLFTHNSWLNDDGTVCFTTDEMAGSWVAAYDITDLNNITEIDRIRPSYAVPGSLPHNVKVVNDWLVTAHYYEGVHIVDADRPHNLVETAYYDTNPDAPNGYMGVWGADPYLPSGLIVAGDRQYGLYIFQPTYLRACYLEGVVTDAVTGQPIYNADVVGVANHEPEATAPDGSYATGTVDAGNYQVTYSKFGYHDTTITVALANGVLTIRDIPLRPLDKKSVTVFVVDQSGFALAGSKVNFELTSGELSTTMTGSMVQDTNFIPGEYWLRVGHWGHVTQAFPAHVYNNDTVITVALAKGYHDDFILDFGWTALGTATQGEWERGEPKGTYFSPTYLMNPEADAANDIGNQCYVTGNSGSFLDDDDVDQGRVTLTSPVMDLTSYNQPVLSYQRWFTTRNMSFGTFGGDTLTIEIDNGLSTVLLRRQTNSISAWVRDTFLIANYISPTANVRVRFTAIERAFDNVVEAGVDAFRVIDLAPVAQDPKADLPEAHLVVAPNPMSGPATVAYDLGSPRKLDGVTFEVHDMTGRRVHVQGLTQAAGQFTLDLNLPSGLYVGSIRMGGQVLGSVRMVK